MAGGRARFAAIFVLIGAVAMGVAGVWLARDRGAPDFDLASREGRRFTLASWKGRPVVLHFWASWCPPCLEELPDWLSAAARTPEIAWVAISLDEGWEQAFRVLPRNGTPESVVSIIDPDRKSADAFGSYQFPETYLLSKSHRIVAKWVGPQDWNGQRAREALAKLPLED